MKINTVMKSVLLLISTALLSVSCVRIDEGEEILYLKVDDSYLPVYVRGNADADTYIIWTHGGPGSSGLYYGDIDEIKVLHEDYRVVFWDQLGSGGSTGNPGEEDYSLSKFASHHDGVVNIVINRYHPDNLFVLGHSWGGFLTSYYLLAEGDDQEAARRQSLFNGVILLNPILDIARSISDGIAYIRFDYAPSQIAQGNDVEKWTAALEWYEDHLQDGLLYGEDVAVHYQYIEDAGGMLVQRDRNDILTQELAPEMIFFSPFHFYDYYNNQNTIRTYLDIADKTLAGPEKPHLNDINIPTLFIAGNDDKIAFNYMSDEWFDLMGFYDHTPEMKDEYFKMYDNCAHAAFLDKPSDFYNDVVSFIENH